MEDPLVSIIVSVYNTEAFLDNCITSIRNQNYKNIQIILVNDGSTDSSPEICLRHAKEDCRVLVINKDNGGVSTARNAGLAACAGTYIMFVDSDDWIKSNAIETLINIQKTFDFDVILFGYYIENKMISHMTRVSSPRQSYIGKDQLMSAVAQMIGDGRLHQLWNKFYKTDILRKHGILFDERLDLAEDALFNYNVIFEVESLHITEQCLYHYTIREQSLDHRYNPQKFKMLSYVNDWLQNKIKENKDYFIVKQQADHIRFKNVFSCIFDLFRNDCKLTGNEKRVILQSLALNERDYPYCLSNRLYRILLFILRTNNVELIYMTAFIIYTLRRFYKDTRCSVKNRETTIWPVKS